jgi:hypothetical protein
MVKSVTAAIASRLVQLSPVNPIAASNAPAIALKNAVRVIDSMCTPTTIILPRLLLESSMDTNI